jgi:uncharacterized RDD family membrane protein YckC
MVDNDASESVQRQLQQLVQTYGASVTEDRRRCEALLRDLAGEHRREVNMLVSALSERVPSELLSGQGRTPTSIQLHQLTRRLQDNQGLAETSAQWAVGAWAVALGTASQDDVEHTFSKPPGAAAVSVPPATGASSTGFVAPAAAEPVPPQPGTTESIYPGATFVYAGFWLRFIAQLIDGVILSIVSAILLAVLRQGTLYFLVSILAGWLYAAYFWSSANQATPGKMALGLIVTDEQGRRIPFSTATIRYFSQWLSTIILFIGFLMVAWDPRKQGLHDKIAHTFVLRKPH